MSNRYVKPKANSPKEMFIWWAKKKIKAKRYLKLKYVNSNSKDTILVYKTGDELKWCISHLDVLQEEIDRLTELDTDKYNITSMTRKIYELKKEVEDTKKKIEHLKQLNPSREEVLMSEALFREVIYRFNRKMIDELIEGKVINMKNYLGYLYVSKIPRNDPKYFGKGGKTIDWAESNKYKKELIEEGKQPKDEEHPDGENWFIYYQDDFYLRFAWAKRNGACRVKNHTFYEFKPARGKNGVTKKLFEENKKRRLLHTRYKTRKF